MFESRASAFKGRSADAVSKIQERRAEAIRSVQECQECLLGSIQHYGIALQLGQKHVYQALPRLLAMWLEFTALEGKDVTGQHGKLKSSVINAAILLYAPLTFCCTIFLCRCRDRSFVYKPINVEQYHQKPCEKHSGAFVLYDATSAHLSCRTSK